MSSVFGGNEVELGLGGLRKPSKGKMGEEPHEGIVILSTLQSIERELRRIRSFVPEYGRQYIRRDGAQANAGGEVFFQFEAPKSGNDWYVERVVLTVPNHTVAQGIVLLYENLATNDATVDETQLVDFTGLVSLAGGFGARATLDGHGGSPYFIYGGGPGVSVVAGGLTAGWQANVRLQGREVLSGADPALRSQGDY